MGLSYLADGWAGAAGGVVAAGGAAGALAGACAGADGLGTVSEVVLTTEELVFGP